MKEDHCAVEICTFTLHLLWNNTFKLLILCNKKYILILHETITLDVGKNILYKCYSQTVN